MYVRYGPVLCIFGTSRRSDSEREPSCFILPRAVRAHSLRAQLAKRPLRHRVFLRRLLHPRPPLSAIPHLVLNTQPLF